MHLLSDARRHLLGHHTKTLEFPSQGDLSVSLCPFLPPLDEDFLFGLLDPQWFLLAVLLYGIDKCLCLFIHFYQIERHPWLAPPPAYPTGGLNPGALLEAVLQWTRANKLKLYPSRIGCYWQGERN